MSQSFVYLIHNPNKDEVKIGYTTNPMARLSQLQTGTTDRLDLLTIFPGGLAEERILHQTLLTESVSGEWFRYTSKVGEAFKEAMAKSIPEYVDSDKKGGVAAVTVAILDVCNTFKTQFKITDIKKALPSLTWRTKAIEEFLLLRGYKLKTYKTCAVKYFYK